MEFKTKKGVVIVNDAEVSELKDLIPIYKAVFSVHHIFQDKNESKILSYLEENADDFIVAKIGAKIVGGLLVVLENECCGHSVWKYKHVAVAEGYQDFGVGSHLITFADAKVKKQGLKTNKIEVHVSENEKDALDFYKKNGFKVEGELMSHYRPGEKVYFLGKEI